jgi:histone H3/H4
MRILFDLCNLFSRLSICVKTFFFFSSCNFDSRQMLDEHVCCFQNKAISDKSRWSFRRRSTRHRVLKNSDISEPETLSSSKAKSDITPSNNAYSSTYSYVSEKPLNQDKQDGKVLHQEKPEEKTLHNEKSDEKLAEKPIEKAVDKAMEEPGDRITEQPVEKIDQPVEKMTDALTEDAAEKITEKVTETTSEEPAERMTENPAEEASEKAVEVPIEEPNESVSVSSTRLKQDEAASHVEESSDPKEDQLESSAIVIQSGIRTCIVCCYA